MRRQLAVNNSSSVQDMESIQSIELLGEGTFGKVSMLSFLDSETRTACTVNTKHRHGVRQRVGHGGDVATN